MQVRPLGTAEAGVSRIPQQGVPENEPGSIDEIWLRTGDEGPTPQCVDLYLRLRHTERAERSQGEPPARHRHPPDRIPGRGSQVVELARVERLDCRREDNLIGHCGQPPPAVRGAQDPGGDPAAEQLLNEQRVPVRTLPHRLHQLRWEGLADKGSYQCRRVYRRQRLQGEDAGAPPHRLPTALAPLGVTLEDGRSRRGQDQPACSRPLRTCECEKLEDVGARPVGVLDQPDTPPALRQGVQTLQPGGEYRLPDGPSPRPPLAPGPVRTRQQGGAQRPSPAPGLDRCRSPGTPGTPRARAGPPDRTGPPRRAGPVLAGSERQDHPREPVQRAPPADGTYPRPAGRG